MIKTKLIHWKIKHFGDKELETDGKIIPCLRCDKPFMSYSHYSGGGTYTSYCNKCIKYLEKHEKEKR